MSAESELSFPEFRTFLAGILGVAEEEVRPEARFFKDLHIDSLRILEIVTRLEKLLGMELPSDVAWEIRTVDDAYAYYLRCLRDRAT
jgi:acyl carrier protein